MVLLPDQVVGFQGGFAVLVVQPAEEMLIIPGDLEELLPVVMVVGEGVPGAIHVRGLQVVVVVLLVLV
jgi:hypothetical protein